MNKFTRAIEIILVAIITDLVFLLSGLTAGLGVVFILNLILLPFFCSFLFYMIIQSPSPKEKLAFTLFRLIIMFAAVKFMDTRYLGGEEVIFYAIVWYATFLDAVLSVLVFYLIGWWLKRKQFSVFLGIRGKRVVTILMTCFMIVTAPILFENYWHYFDGSWSGTYVGRFSNDKVVLDEHYFCYNDVVEADFKVRNSKIVLDIDSIRIKENSADIYSDSQKQHMLDDIIFLAQNNSISMGASNSEMWFRYDSEHFDLTELWRVSDTEPAFSYPVSPRWGTYVDADTNDKVVLDQYHFCYNDVVEADFKYGDGAVVLDIDSIRIKENSSDIYTDSQKQQMLDEITSLAENNGFHLADGCLYVCHYSSLIFNIFERVR